MADPPSFRTVRVFIIEVAKVNGPFLAALWVLEGKSEGNIQLMLITYGGSFWRPLSTIGTHFMESSHLEEIEERIIHSLSQRPSSSISEIARELRVNRSTASKYLHVLRAKRKVQVRQVGPVKLWSLEDV